MNVVLLAVRRDTFYCQCNFNRDIRVLLERCRFQIGLHIIEPGFEFVVIVYTVTLRLHFQVLLYSQC